MGGFSESPRGLGSLTSHTPMRSSCWSVPWAVPVSIRISDGVCDADDNCPAVANPNQEDTFGDPDMGDACEVPQLVMCDVSGDGAIDIFDIRAIMARRGQQAGPDDPADANGNGVIGVDDGRLCVLQCTLPRCAPVPQ